MTTTATNPEQVVDLPIVDISTRDWNSRLGIREDKELKTLAASIEAEGLLQPIVVSPGPLLVVKGESRPGYVVNYGNRRLAAFKLLGRTTIPAIVRPAMSDLDYVLRNVGENVARKDLTTFEVARACSEIRNQIVKSGEKVTLEQVGKQLGMSGVRVGALCRAYETLPQVIKEHWKKEGTAQDDDVKICDAAFVDELTQLKEPDKQIKAFNERKKAIESATATGGKKAGKAAKAAAKKATKKTITVSADRLKAYRKAVKEGLITQKVMQVVDYLFGEVDSVPGIFEKPEEE